MARSSQAKRWIVGLALAGAAALLWVLGTREADDQREAARVAAGGESERGSPLEGRSGAEHGAPAALVAPEIIEPDAESKRDSGTAVQRAGETEAVWVDFELRTKEGEPAGGCALDLWAAPSSLPAQAMLHYVEPPPGPGHALATVVPMESTDPAPDRRVTANATGRCHIELSAGRYCFSAFLPAAGWSGYRMVDVASSAGAAPGADAAGPHVRVELDPPTHVEGVVVDRRGKAVPGARVRFALESGMYALPDEPEDRRSRDPPALVCDAAGRFCVDVDGPYWGTVQAESGAVRSPALALVGQSEVELVVGSTCTITGLVIDPEGRPVAGANILIRCPLMPLVEARELMSGEQPAGSFSIEVDEPGTYVLFAAHTKRALTTGEAPRVVVDEQSPRAEVQLTLCPMERITGRVRDPQGVPIEGFELDAWQTDSSFALQLELWEQGWLEERASDAEGRFTIERLQPGVAYDLVTSVRNANGDWRRPTLARGVLAGSSDVEVVFDPAAAQDWSVHGRVVEASTANAILDYDLGLKLHEPLMQAYLDADPEDGRATREADGSFLLSGLVAGRTYRIAVTPEGGEPETFAVPAPAPAQAPGATEPLVVAVRSRAELVVQVVDATGAPAAGATVHCVVEEELNRWSVLSGSWPRAQATADGSLRFEGLRAGSYLLQANSADGATSALARVALGHGQALEQTLRLTGAESGGRVLLRALDGKQHPVRGVEVTLERLGLPPTSRPVVGRTDARGEHLSSGLGPGVYDVECKTAAHGNLQPEREVVLIWGGEALELLCPVID